MTRMTEAGGVAGFNFGDSDAEKWCMSALSAARTLAIIETQSAIASASLTLDGVMALVVSRAQEITGAAAGVVELIEGEEMVYHAVSGAAEPFAGVRLAVKTSLSGRCLLQNDVLLCEDAEDDPRLDREACLKVGARSMLCAPLVHGERAVGVLKVYDPNAYAFGEDDVTTLRVLSGIIATAMAHAGDFELQRYESRHDTLTGLPNRRAFDEQLEREIARASRYSGKLTLCLADLDAFKAVNDRQGHAAGDSVLRAVATILKRLRDTDQAFRFGGDEFAVIFPGVDYVSARTAVHRAQTAVERDQACLGVGLSWGLADLSAQDANTLMMRAEAALYKAKGERRRPLVPPDADRDQIATGSHSAQR
jgi:diguanylate cyclase (GGDEF)-like protein